VAGDEHPAGPRRPVRVPYLIGAAALAVATAVLVLWGFSRAADRTEVIVVREPVAAGTPIPASALSTTMVGDDMLAVPADGSGEVPAVVVSSSVHSSC
jgi:hypothetical protein